MKKNVVLVKTSRSFYMQIRRYRGIRTLDERLSVFERVFKLGGVERSTWITLVLKCETSASTNLEFLFSAKMFLRHAAGRKATTFLSLRIAKISAAPRSVKKYFSWLDQLKKKIV